MTQIEDEAFVLLRSIFLEESKDHFMLAGNRKGKCVCERQRVR